MSDLICGIHAIEAMLKNNPERFLCVYILRGFLNKRLELLLQELKQLDISIQYCNRHYLNNKIQYAVHQGIVARIHKTCVYSEKDIPNLLEKKNNVGFLLLILDGITDPRNLGACLRCAGAFGVDMVIVPRHHSARLTATVRKVASGSADCIPFIRVTNLARVLQTLKEYNIWIVGTVLEPKNNIFQAKLARRLALVMGSEELGIKHLTRQHCNELVYIPMFDASISLNVSVATGICLFEVLRRRVYFNK